MLKQLRSIKLTCDQCGIEKIHVREYSWQPPLPEGWITGFVYAGFFQQLKYKHYCSVGCYKKRAVGVEIAP